MASHTVDNWLTGAIRLLLEAQIPSARLDAELILAHTVRKPRTWLHAHGDEPLDARTIDIANARLDLRRDRVPIAYIIGHKDFYGRRFRVTTATLIPRPESEAVITLLLALPVTTGHLVDAGTGTGCLGITAALERPAFDVTLLDIDRHTLAIAEKNATTLHATVSTLQSNLLDAYPYEADVILANLPYVDRTWENSPELRHEPDGALYADDNGLLLIKRLIDQTSTKLRTGGYIILEADVRQHHAMTHYARQHGLQHIATEGLAVCYQRP